MRGAVGEESVFGVRGHNGAPFLKPDGKGVSPLLQYTSGTSLVLLTASYDYASDILLIWNSRNLCQCEYNRVSLSCFIRL